MDKWIVPALDGKRSALTSRTPLEGFCKWARGAAALFTLAGENIPWVCDRWIMLPIGPHSDAAQTKQGRVGEPTEGAALEDTRLPTMRWKRKGGGRFMGAGICAANPLGACRVRSREDFRVTSCPARLAERTP